jgi:hexosaminidase
MEIFPSKFIHIGGDEVNKKFWKKCSSCQAHIKKNKLHGEHGLQSWFIQQLDNHITSKGRRLIGWDEILEGGLAKNATVMSWRGEQGGIKASKMGHDVVMSPQTYIYLDHGQSHSPLEPPHWPGHKPLSRAYGYEPVSKSLSKSEAKHVLGVQGNVWTAFVHEEWLVDICTWPRAAAIAEVGWSPKAARNWDDFYTRLNTTHRKRLDNLGVNYWWETSAELGTWKPAMLKADDEPVELTFDISDQIKNFHKGRYQVNLHYTGGKHALSILSTSLLENGKAISTDAHEGITGSSHKKNLYALDFPTIKKGSKYTLKVKAFGSAGTDSNGKISVSSVETKQLK